MNDEAELVESLKELFAAQKYAVLGTHCEGEPYASLIAFSASEDCECIVFATGRATRKFSNLTADPRASLLVDNRSNDSSDLRRAMAVTAVGRVREVFGAEREELSRLLLKQSPALDEFVSSPSCALMEFRVNSYYAVRRFQHVMEWHLNR